MTQRRFRVDPYESHMAVSINWRSFLGGSLRALLFEVYFGAPDFWKLPSGLNSHQYLYLRRTLKYRTEYGTMILVIIEAPTVDGV